MMKLSLSFILAAISCTTVLAERDTFAQEERDHNYCETTDKSPYLHHVDALIKNMKNHSTSNETICLDTWSMDNRCGGTFKRWSYPNYEDENLSFASFQFCTSWDDISGVLPCHEDLNEPLCRYEGDCNGMLVKTVIQRLEELRDACKKKDSKGDLRVGGRHTFEDGGEVRLFTTPS